MIIEQLPLRNFCDLNKVITIRSGSGLWPGALDSNDEVFLGTWLDLLVKVMPNNIGPLVLYTRTLDGGYVKLKGFIRDNEFKDWSELWRWEGVRLT